MEIRTSSINFSKVRGSGPQQRTAAIHFPREVLRATAGITGYTAGFSQDTGDHHVGNLKIRVESSVDGDLVNVTATLGVRDWSGDWDDNYEGTVQFVVLADLASATDPRPRGDIEITGLEFNQATQHFRSDRHLDPANVMPDNTIPLIARKDTCVRVYIDYDANSGLPLINNLSGTLEINTGFTTVVLSPFNSITPMRDNLIDRGQVNHTLNFHIPEGLCQGELNLSCKVFDSSNTTFPSRTFQRSIIFQEHEPVRMHAVAVHYTGQGLDLAEPTLAQITGDPAFSFMEVVYPVPEVLITGYATLDYSEDMRQANIQDGCGDGYSHLLDKLRDLRGGSSDAYFGFMPNGFDGGQVGGCGGGGVAAGPFTGFGVLTQETGHAYGRNHAPCDNSTRCGNPANQDSSYPHYAEFASDSIGEYGYNPRSGNVFAPQTNFDFMSYSGPIWVSPYTYMGLLNSFPLSSGLSSEAFGLTFQSKKDNINKFQRKNLGTGYPNDIWTKKDALQLYLWLTIDRQRKVTREPSFVFASQRVNEQENETNFTVELQDAEGNILTCQTLYCDCGDCQGNCFPKKFRQFVPYYDGAQKLIVYEDEDIIYEEALVTAPQVKINAISEKEQKQMKITWKPIDYEDKELWYLVHWRDADGQWRGLQSRSTQTTASLPLYFFGRNKKLPIRVLCSTGIYTTITEYTLELEEENEDDIQVNIYENTNGGLLNLNVISFNKVIRPSDIIWYNANDHEIGRGRAIDTTKVVEGENIVKVSVLHDGKKYDETIIINRTRDNIECTKLDTSGRELLKYSKTKK
ncbi:MAG: hypothetical protein ABI683_15440 [Ginsengibacter sp.]